MGALPLDTPTPRAQAWAGIVPDVGTYVGTFMGTGAPGGEGRAKLASIRDRKGRGCVRAWGRD